MSRISRRPQVHRRDIAIAMAGLVLLAQLVLAVHGVVHLASAGHDHCEIAQVAHAVAAQLPSVPFQLIISIFHQPPQAGVLPAFMRSEPRHGPPIRAPPLYG